MPSSPHDNIPELEGDVWILTARLDEPIEEDGETRETISCATIQPSKEEAYKRLVYIAKTQWHRDVEEIVEAEQLEGDRDEQLDELTERQEESMMATPDLVKQEFIDYITTMPLPVAVQMFQNLPDYLQDDLEGELPPAIKQRV